MKVLRVTECFLSLNCECACVGVQASVCVLARSQSPANNVSMVGRSPRHVWREMCNLTLLPATQSQPYTHAVLKDKETKAFLYKVMLSFV